MRAAARRWPIYATKRLVDILPHLCTSGEQPPFADAVAGHARELIFCPLDRQLLTEVSPSMRVQSIQSLVASIEQSLHRFAVYNTRAKEYVCINGLFNAVGAADFGKILRLLRLQHKLDSIDAQTLNEYFKAKLAEGSEIALLDAVDMVLLLLQRGSINSIFQPFVEGSLRTIDILRHIVEAESKLAFNHFLAEAPSDLRLQTCDFLKSADSHTGLLIYPWGYVELQRILMGNNADVSSEKHARVASGTTPKTGHATHEHTGNGIDNAISDLNIAQKVDTIAGVNLCLKVLRRYGHHHGDVHNGLVGVHLENDVAVLYIPDHTFIIDLLVTDPYYQDTVFYLLAWLWSNSALVKVGYHLLQKVSKLASQLDRPFMSFSNLIDLRNERVKECFGDDLEQPRIKFKPSGVSKNLIGLMQEYNIPVLQANKMWKYGQRPICSTRTRYLENIAKGIVRIEEHLRDDGWYPTDSYKLESPDNG
eukprot:XP_001611021.1 hypothetical protein [Babesia bovis T2Bo]